MAMPDFTMRQLLEAGVHFGHHTRRWNPRMAPFLFGVRNQDMAVTESMGPRFDRTQENLGASDAVIARDPDAVAAAVVEGYESHGYVSVRMSCSPGAMFPLIGHGRLRCPATPLESNPAGNVRRPSAPG